MQGWNESSLGDRYQKPHEPAMALVTDADRARLTSYKDANDMKDMEGEAGLGPRSILA